MNIYIGKLVSTHGINGELKLLSDFEKKDRVLKAGMKFYIEGNEYVLKNSRPHKQYDLIKLNDYTNINEVLFLVGLDVYVKKEDLNLEDGEYLLSDLVGAKVIDEDSQIGVVTEVLLGSRNNLIRIKDDTSEFLIPLIDQYIKEFDVKENILYTINAKDLKI